MLGVRPPDVAMRGTPGRNERSDDDIPRGAQPAPLDLNTEQIATNFQRKVGTPVFCDRPQYGYAELGGRKHDRLLGDGSLDVRIHHERRFAYASDGKAAIAGETR